MGRTIAAGLFPADVVCFEVSPLPEDLPLLPGEAHIVAGAGAKRRREFAAGRWLAHLALRELGFADSAVVTGTDRAPLWPAGAVGSISHTDDYCVVVVGRSLEHRSLGVDAEPATPLEEHLWVEICTPPERERIATLPPAERGLACHVLFTIKECVYKYQYPISRAFLEFHDASVSTDARTGTFRATFELEGIPGFPVGTVLAGRFVIADGLIVAGLH